MTIDEYKQAVQCIVYLCGCVVNEEKPDTNRISSCLDDLYKAAQSHMLTVIVATALEMVGIISDKFTQAKVKAIRKTLLLETERLKVEDEFERNNIWYLNLKGRLIGECYPDYSMRQMSDVDICVNHEKVDEVCDIMKNNGFQVKSYGIGVHDIYYKEPVYNFEIHRELFGMEYNEKFRQYYADPLKYAVRDKNKGCGYSFMPEDSYVYMMTHIFKHFSSGGTGLKSLLDCYVF